ncbi:hypothetical protein KKF63_10485 [bacterium]|nr:hypothetical protein [bacterium]
MFISLGFSPPHACLAGANALSFSDDFSRDSVFQPFGEEGVIGYASMGRSPAMLSGLFREDISAHRILSPKRACQEDYFSSAQLINSAATLISDGSKSGDPTTQARKALEAGTRVFFGLERGRAPSQRIITDMGRKAILGQGRLANMIFGRARNILEAREKGEDFTPKPIYSTAVILPMTEWNSYNNAVGNVMKEISYLVQREFLSSEHETIDAFLENLSTDSLLRDHESTAGQVTLEERETGQTTVVNGVIIAAQLNDTSKLKYYLENIGAFIFGVVNILLNKKEALENKSALTVREEAKLNGIEALIGGFYRNSSGKIFFSYYEKGVRHEVPFEKLYLNLVSAGIAKYDESLEEHEGFTADKALHNLIWIRKEVQRMRDEAIKNAELAASKKEPTVIVVDSPLAKIRADQSWRDGSHLSSDDILASLVAIIQDTKMGAEDRPRKYARGPKTNVLKNQRKTSANRLFKGVDWNDLSLPNSSGGRGIALEAALHFVKGGRASVTKASSPEDLAKAWLAALEDRSFLEKPSQAAREFSEALESLFFESITNARVLALYHECGGFVDPQRIMRQFYSLQTELFDNVQQLYSLGSVNDNPNYNSQLEEITAKLNKVINEARALMSFVGHDIRDRETRPREIVAPAARKMVAAFYSNLEQRNLSVENAGYHIIGFEAKNAKVLDRETNPISPYHVLDTNMIRMRRIARLVAREVFGQKDGGVTDCVESYAQGDEMVAFFPKHKRDGSLVTLEEINAAYRKVLQRLFPQNKLHYNHKQDVDEGTLRLKEWHVRAIISAPGFPDKEEEYIIAADKSAFNNPASKEQRFWVLAKGGARVQTSFQGLLNRGDINILHRTPVLGPISARLCALSLPLIPKKGFLQSSANETDTLLDRAVDLVMALDAQVKEEIKKAERGGEPWGAPEKDLWVFNAELSTFSRVGMPH